MRLYANDGTVWFVGDGPVESPVESKADIPAPEAGRP